MYLAQSLGQAPSCMVASITSWSHSPSLSPSSKPQAPSSVSSPVQVGLRSLPTPFQVQWLLKPNNTIHVQLNNQTIAFETNGEDTKGRLGLSCLPGSGSAGCPALGSRVLGWRGSGLGVEHHGHHPMVPPAAVREQLLHWSQALNFPLHISPSSGASSLVPREKRVGWATSMSCECALWSLEKDRARHLPAAFSLLSASLNFTADKSWASRAPKLAFSSFVSQHSRPGNLQQLWSHNDPLRLHDISQFRWCCGHLRARYLQHPPHLLQPFEGVSEPH